MWCEKILRNLGEPVTADGRAVDWVDVQWQECGRVLKKQTRGGEPVRVILPLGERLRHGDVICEDAGRIIAIQVLPCEVIVARALATRAFGLLALELGNLHHPAELGDREIIFVEDGPAMAVLEQMGLAWRKEVRRFAPVPVRSAPAARLSKDFRVIRRE